MFCLLLSFTLSRLTFPRVHSDAAAYINKLGHIQEQYHTSAHPPPPVLQVLWSKPTDHSLVLNRALPSPYEVYSMGTPKPPNQVVGLTGKEFESLP